MRKSRFLERAKKKESKIGKRLAKAESKFKKTKSEIDDALADFAQDQVEEVERELVPSDQQGSNEQIQLSGEGESLQAATADGIDEAVVDNELEKPNVLADQTETVNTRESANADRAHKKNDVDEQVAYSNAKSDSEPESNDVRDAKRDGSGSKVVTEEGVDKVNVVTGAKAPVRKVTSKPDQSKPQTDSQPSNEDSDQLKFTAEIAKKSEKTSRASQKAKPKAAIKSASQPKVAAPKMVTPAKPAVTPARIAPSGLGRGKTKVEVTELIKKIIDRLNSDQSIYLVSKYREHFLGLLEQTSDNFGVVVTFITDDDSIGGKWYLDKRCAFRNIDFWNLSASADTSTLTLGDNISDVWITNWNAISDLTPIKLGLVQKEIDLYVINSLPKTFSDLESIELLQRICSSGAIVVFDESLKEKIESIIEKHKHCFGYTLFDDDSFSYVSMDGSSARAYVADFDIGARTALVEFSAFRRLTRLAENLQADCLLEIERQKLDWSSAHSSDALKELKARIAKMDLFVKGALAQSKSILSNKGMDFDEFGIPKINSEPSSAEVAQGLLAEFSLKDLIREDELDILKYEKEDRRYINRFNRFKFASKFNYLWKLSPDYMMNLHSKVMQVIENRVLQQYLGVSEKVEKCFAQIKEVVDSSRQKVYADRFAEFKGAWKSESHLTALVKQKFDISDFRAFVFSKKGNEAPVEVQTGMIKELKESRMFVSQLMAFGMLGAMLFGSVYAVDVFSSWVSGDNLEFGAELTQAARDSRSLGRQVRILIAGVAGVGIVFYLMLRFYLKKPEALVERQKVVDSYSDHLQEVVSNYLNSSTEFSREIVGLDLEMLSIEYEEFKSALTALTEQEGDVSEGLSIKESALNANITLKKIEGLIKWLTGILAERETLSLMQAYKASNVEAKGKVAD